MDKELKVVISAEDRASVKLDKIKEVLGKLENETANTTKTTNKLGISQDNLSGIISKGAFVATLGAEAVMRLADEVVNLGKASIDYAGDLQMIEAGFRTFLKDANETDRVLQAIREDALKTPFDLRGLAKGNQMLISAGVNADDARKDILNLGNAIIATGGGQDEMNRLIANMQQIKNIGVATEMDLRQFGFAGINIYQLLAQSTGKNVEELKKMDITYEMLSNSLDVASKKGGMFEGALQNLSGSYNLVTANITETIGLIGSEILTATGAFDLLVSGLNFINNFLQENKDEIISYFVMIKDNLIALGNFIAGNATQFWNKYGEDVTYIFNGLITIIVGLIKYLSAWWNNEFNFIRIFTERYLKTIAEDFAFFFDLMIKSAKFWIAIMTGDFETAKKTIVEIFNFIYTNIANRITESIKLTIKSFEDLFNNVKTWFGKIWDFIKETTDKIRNAIKDAFDFNKKGSPSYNDLLSETEKKSTDKLSKIFSNTFGNSGVGTSNVSNPVSNVNINFNGNMSVRSDDDINKLAMEVKRIINREDVLYSQGII